VPQNFPYRLRESFLSPAEVNFYQALRGVLRDQLVVELLTIAPKVSLLEMVSVVRPNENVHYFNRLMRQSVDFLLIHRPTLHPTLAIELEYPKQARHRTDRFLDELFRAVSLPFLRVTVEDKYDGNALASQIRGAMPSSRPQPQLNEEHYSPICPDCGITMVLRFHRSGGSVGKRYYGCLNYPECRQMIPVD
jgi:uncharacterized protein DUF2726/topoisomerase-like DNA binding C4 zinc finger protein